jgi:ankyrin repeat protein
MFPEPHDALPLPPRPNLDHYKKRAKDLLKAAESSDPIALRDWAAAWIDSLVRLSNLTLTPQLPVRLDHWTDQLENFAREKLSETRTLSAAQFVVARAHGFESWAKLAQHLQALPNSATTHFERAADAIVTGDLATIEKLLHENPALIRAHSTRRHEATLLHYVSANGVEGYRQKTPKNILQIAALLLDAGADLNASANLYGGSTALDLVATSGHPERAGIQEALLQLLLDRGAQPSHGIVNACLANGRIQAAEFLASRGATLDLEAAAGLGRLDTVKSFFDKNGNLLPPATNSQTERGFLWACEYGRNNVVEFLLQHVSLDTQAGTGQTALHWSVIGAALNTVNLLLDHSAPLEAKNSYGASALGQALWSALHTNGETDYLPIIETLLKAGAKITPEIRSWLNQQSITRQPINQQTTAASSPVKRRIIEALERHGAKS